MNKEDFPEGWSAVDLLQVVSDEFSIKFCFWGTVLIAWPY